MSFAIRPYHPSDLTALYRICYQTNPSVVDGAAVYRDPELIGHMYAAPYAVLEPDLCFILTHNYQPCGYVLGTRDSVQFRGRCELEWFPTLRQRYPLPPQDDGSRDATLIRLIHQGHRNTAHLGYPAELHIDLLPIAQGQGLGKKMMKVFESRLLRVGVGGVHLGVGKVNSKAIAFYQKLGFDFLQEHPLWWAMGKRLAGGEKQRAVTSEV